MTDKITIDEGVELAFSQLLQTKGALESSLKLVGDEYKLSEEIVRDPAGRVIRTPQGEILDNARRIYANTKERTEPLNTEGYLEAAKAKYWDSLDPAFKAIYFMEIAKQGILPKKVNESLKTIVKIAAKANALKETLEDKTKDPVKLEQAIKTALDIKDPMNLCLDSLSRRGDSAGLYHCATEVFGIYTKRLIAEIEKLKETKKSDKELYDAVKAGAAEKHGYVLASAIMLECAKANENAREQAANTRE